MLINYYTEQLNEKSNYLREYFQNLPHSPDD